MTFPKIIGGVRGSADEANFGEKSVDSPVCFVTNTKANQDPKYKTWTQSMSPL